MIQGKNRGIPRFLVVRCFFTNLWRERARLGYLFFQVFFHLGNKKRHLTGWAQQERPKAFHGPNITFHCKLFHKRGFPATRVSFAECAVRSDSPSAHFQHLMLQYLTNSQVSSPKTINKDRKSGESGVTPHPITSSPSALLRQIAICVPRDPCPRA